MDMFLITGFLGAGKTTFIKNMIKHLSGERIYLIINEFGREGIDGTLLAELGAAIDEIDNGSIFCTCRQDQFEDSLLKATEELPDVILVEASGLSDPTNIHKILARDRFKEINYRGGICLADATRLHKVYDTALVVKKQISISDIILLNKIDMASPELVEEAKKLIYRANVAARIVPTTFGTIDPQLLDSLEQRVTDQESENRVDLSQQKYLLTIDPKTTARQMESFLNIIAEDTYRIKGLVTLADGLYLVDCVGSFVKVTAYTGKVPDSTDKLVVISGKGMPARKSIKEARKWYPEAVVRME